MRDTDLSELRHRFVLNSKKGTWNHDREDNDPSSKLADRGLLGLQRRTTKKEKKEKKKAGGVRRGGHRRADRRMSKEGRKRVAPEKAKGSA